LRLEFQQQPGGDAVINNSGGLVSFNNASSAARLPSPTASSAIHQFEHGRQLYDHQRREC
jgi:hypothetical protein